VEDAGATVTVPKQDQLCSVDDPQARTSQGDSDEETAL